MVKERQFAFCHETYLLCTLSKKQRDSVLIGSLSLSCHFFSCIHDFRGCARSAVCGTDLAHAGRDCWGQVVSALLLLTTASIDNTDSIF